MQNHPSMTKPSALSPSPSSPSPSSKLGIVDKSQVIAKLKPKIRVIHVDSPKVIQTDAANFRDLVQRLTGKQQPGDSNVRRTMEKGGGDFLGLRIGKRIKNEEDEEEEDDDEDEISRRSKSNNKEIRLSTDLFDHHHHPHGFSELDGFIEQLGTMN